MSSVTAPEPLAWLAEYASQVIINILGAAD